MTSRAEIERLTRLARLRWAAAAEGSIDETRAKEAMTLGNAALKHWRDSHGTPLLSNRGLCDLADT
jgi:hypothetical protein